MHYLTLLASEMLYIYGKSINTEGPIYLRTHAAQDKINDPSPQIRNKDVPNWISQAPLELIEQTKRG